MPTYRGKFSADPNPNSDDAYPALNAENLEEAIKFANRKWPAKEGEGAFTASVMQVFTNAGWISAEGYEGSGFNIRSKIDYDRFFERNPRKCAGRFTLIGQRQIEPGMLYREYEDGQTIDRIAQQFNVLPLAVIMSIHFCQEKPDALREYDERDD